MPTYEYACKSCGERLEVQQRFTDDPLTECPACGGVLRKVFGNVGITFKGSGFYKTDSRSSSKSTSSSSVSSSSADSSKGESTSDGTKTESKSESTPKTDSGSGTPAAAAS